MQRSILRPTPAPDPDRWRAIADRVERLRTALRDTYAYHRATEAMIARVLADARDHEVMAPYHAHRRHAADVLVAPWRARGRRRTLLRAGIALALSFDTWRSLVRDLGLTDEQAVEVALRITADHPPRRRRRASAQPAGVTTYWRRCRSR